MEHRFTRWLHRLKKIRRSSEAFARHDDPSAFRITCSVRDDPSFTAEGALDDEGAVLGPALPEREDRSSWIGNRVLKGRKGQLFVLIDATYVAEGATVARGTFEIVDGAGDYAGLRADGAYRATAARSGGGVETLTGRLHEEPGCGG